MSEQQTEHLSALVDGEIDPVLLHATLSALESNRELGETWERYHLIGSALRGEGVRVEYRQIAARVSDSVAREPVPLAPPASGHGRSSRVGPFIGAALAASAAFLAVFAVPQLFDQKLQPQDPAVAVNPSPPPAQFQLATPGQRWHLVQPALQNKLDRFLVNHQEYSPTSSIKGILPYATVVGYEAGR
ncbi:MAG: sigma-E factor negative regulatory protein [Pseudomonadota bacterium]|nr:sigma-E factor negative regulatory protein [Pseudomonadota bacterium]